ncbi:DUF763 domain-containing protein, partial [Rhizobium johnstonii]|uniref:DUF763 domain-containing protein n=1 Tax=Rhizobium johnstonii TaxID=3019933 RepID=UPI003F9627F6
SCGFFRECAPRPPQTCRPSSPARGFSPQELVSIGERVGLDGEGIATTSRLIAKVDRAALQDGFDLYMHGFIVADDGH